jgi:uncharacterized protein YutE (UPF0331/DUF86 family)
VVDRGLAAAKLGELAERVERIRARCPATADELRADRDALDQSRADIAAHLIADEGWPSAPNLGASFARLRDEGVISAATAAALGRAVGLRNVVAHGYAGIDPEMVHAAARAGLSELDTLAREVAQWIAARASAD